MESPTLFQYGWLFNSYVFISSRNFCIVNERERERRKKKSSCCLEIYTRGVAYTFSISPPPFTKNRTLFFHISMLKPIDQCPHSLFPWYLIKTFYFILIFVIFQADRRYSEKEKQARESFVYNFDRIKCNSWRWTIDWNLYIDGMIGHVALKSKRENVQRKKFWMGQSKEVSKFYAFSLGLKLKNCWTSL